MEVNARLLEDLEAFGLTGVEAKTYIKLLSFGEATITMLARSMGLHAAQLYGTLEKLVQKGFVIEQPGRPKVYRAVEPDVALDRVLRDLSERKERLTRALSKIASQAPKLATPPIWLVRGRRNVVETMQDLIDNAEIDILLSTDHSLLPSLVGNLEKAQSRGVETYILIFSPGAPRDLLERVMRLGRVRVGRKGDFILITDMDKCLYIQHAVLSSGEAGGYALLTSELSLVDLFMHNFIRQWNIARPLKDSPDVSAPHRYTCHRLALADIEHLLKEGYAVEVVVEGVLTKEQRRCEVKGRVREVTIDPEEGIYNFLVETDDGLLLRVGGADAYVEDVAARVIEVRALSRES